MTIQEAIKSGKPFKRRVWDYVWTIVDDDRFYYLRGCEDDYFKPNEFDPKDILADDWEVKEE